MSFAPFGAVKQLTAAIPVFGSPKRRPHIGGEGYSRGTKTDPVFVPVRLVGGRSTILTSNMTVQTIESTLQSGSLGKFSSYTGLRAGPKTGWSIFKLHIEKDNFSVL